MAHFRRCLFQEAFSNFSRSDVIFSIIKSHCGICTSPPSLVIFFACLVYIHLCLYHLDFGEGSGTPLFLPGESHLQRSLVGYSPSGRLRVRHDWATSLSLFIFMHWRRNSLQCSCLENPRDGGAWWAAVYEVAQSRTWLKRLSSSSSILISPEISNYIWHGCVICHKRTYLSLVNFTEWLPDYLGALSQFSVAHSWSACELRTQHQNF